MFLVHDIGDNNTLSKTVLTFGNFDGLHLGHFKIIDKVKKIAKNENPDNWVSIRDATTGKILYSQIPERDYSAESYKSYLKNQLNNNSPIAAPRIKKIRVLNEIVK